MIDALLARASTRFIFVVGKGGVGKTTTAGALALKLADQGIATHLISTDPAHSLSDLFAGAQCSEHLRVEEFHARTYADEFFREMRGPLGELIERGSYLDAKDAASFLDLSIPGIDEVMGALRLVDLEQSDAARIVVDTAPTGHTLRLLDSGEIIESWVAAGRAMGEKAGVVASALVGRAVRLRAEALLDEWHARVQRFEKEVLANGSAIVVTRSGNIVNEETRRLIDQLQSRNIAVAAVLAVGDAVEKADFSVDVFAQSAGCEALRSWPAHVHKSASSRTPARQHSRSNTQADTRSAEPWLTKLPVRLVWVAGKGGVGKSTCAAAIATCMAEQRRVCLISTDPAGSLSEVLDTAVGVDAVQIAPNLDARQIDAVAEFTRMREKYRVAVDEVFESLGLNSAAALDRKVVESLWDFAPPGIDEIISLIEILGQAPDYDVLIIDSAPTGHFLRLLQMPELALDWVHALLRLLVKYGAAVSLDALAKDLLAFAKQLRQIKLDLSTPETTAVFVVTLAQPMVEAETARLSSTLLQAGVPVTATILNRADDGERGAGDTWILAPDPGHEIVGPAMLRSFVAQWRLIASVRE